MKTSKRELSTDPVLHRIMDLLNEQNKTQKELTDYLGMHPNTFNCWKFSNVKSYLKRIVDIAEYLNVTPSYLIKGNDCDLDTQEMTPLELKISNKLKDLSIKQQKTILFIVEEFALTNNHLR